MTKGYDQHQQRQMALSAFGKDLARRAKSKCELSGAANVPLHIYEIPPTATEPAHKRCLLLCENVIDQLNKAGLIVPDQWRNLGELIWSDTSAVQIMACRILSYIAKEENWAQDILDEAYLDEEVIDEAMKQPLD